MHSTQARQQEKGWARVLRIGGEHERLERREPTARRHPSCMYTPPLKMESIHSLEVEQNHSAWLRRSETDQISGRDATRARGTEPSHQCAKRRARHKARSKWCGTQNVAREDALIRTRPMNGSTSYRIRVCAASRTHDARVGKNIRRLEATHQARRGTSAQRAHFRV